MFAEAASGAAGDAGDAGEAMRGDARRNAAVTCRWQATMSCITRLGLIF